MSRALIAAIEKAMDRRSFLGKLSMAGGTLLLGILGLPKTAEGLHHVACCDLCVLPGSCTYTPANCGAQWYWCCCYNNRLKHCMECYAPSQTTCPSNLCDNVICSRAADCYALPPGNCPECQCCLPPGQTDTDCG